jgi:hypothetical protein
MMVEPWCLIAISVSGALAFREEGLGSSHEGPADRGAEDANVDRGRPAPPVADRRDGNQDHLRPHTLSVLGYVAIELLVLMR